MLNKNSIRELILNKKASLHFHKIFMKYIYSHLFNKRGGWNKHGGGAKVAKSLNVEAGINVEGGFFGKN